MMKIASRHMGYRSSLAGLNREKGCFHTTIVIEEYDAAYKVSNVLLDTGASATMVSRELVIEAGLQTFRVFPKAFELADGRKVIHDEIAVLNVWIAGVLGRVEAYVDDSRSSLLMLLGTDVMETFLMRMDSAYGSRKEWHWTAAQDVTGLRKDRKIIEEDMRGTPVLITEMTRREGREWSKRHGLTIEELKAKNRRNRYAIHRERFEDSIRLWRERRMPWLE